MTVVMDLGEKVLKWVLKREVGIGFGGRRRLVRVGVVVGLKIMVLEEERGDDLRICKPILDKSIRPLQLELNMDDVPAHYASFLFVFFSPFVKLNCIFFVDF